MVIDDIPRKEPRRLEKNGDEPILRNSHWLLLNTPLRQIARQLIWLTDLLTDHLKTVLASLLQDDLQPFWEYNLPCWAGWVLTR